MIKAIAIYLYVVAGISFLWVAGGEDCFSFYGAPIPQPETGQTVPIIVNHNRTVFITQKQDKIIDLGNTAAISILGISLMVLIFWPLRQRTSNAV